jgi:hypothetical protein
MSNIKMVKHSVEVERDGDRTIYTVKPSTKGAIKGAAVGMTIGRGLGPYGVIGGAIIGGTLGFIFGETD